MMSTCFITFFSTLCLSLFKFLLSLFFFFNHIFVTIFGVYCSFFFFSFYSTGWCISRGHLFLMGGQRTKQD